MRVKEYKVNTTKLAKDAAEIDSLLKNMQSSLEKITGCVNQMNKMWEGPAKDEFQKVYKDDVKYAEKVLKEVKALSAYDNNAKTTYEKCEDSVMKLIGSIKI